VAHFWQADPVKFSQAPKVILLGHAISPQDGVIGSGHRPYFDPDLVWYHRPIVWPNRTYAAQRRISFPPGCTPFRPLWMPKVGLNVFYLSLMA
jgi:hypothetical protein